MNIADLDDHGVVVEHRAAGDVLRPALLLWMLLTGVLGGTNLLLAYLWNASTSGLLPVVLFEVGYLCFVAVVVRFAWRDRELCTLWVRPRRGMVELCVVVGIAGAMLLGMWERGIPVGSGSTSYWQCVDTLPVWLPLLLIGVLPAVFEELAYRGVMLQRFRQVLPLPLAIALQAMLFSVMHVDGVYLLPHFAFGLLAGLLRAAARALWPCMLMHFLWNSWVVLARYDWW